MMQNLFALIGVLILTTQVMAGSWTSNNFLYKPDEGARGQHEKARFDSGSDRIDARLGKEIWVGDPNWGPTFQDAVAAIGATPVILRLPPGTHSIIADLTTPANITLKLERGATISIATGKTMTINGGLEAGPYQIFSCTGTGKVDLSANYAIREVYTEWWGAKADGATDSTAAFQAAFNAVGNNNSDQPIEVRLLKGTYRIHEVTRIDKALLVGVEARITTLQYNGSGGAGSYVINDNFSPAWIGATPWGGFKNLAMYGWDGSASGAIAEHCYLRSGTTMEDWAFKFDNVNFGQCYGDAVVLTGIVNLHFNRLRFDAVGGWAVTVSNTTNGEARPFIINQWTMDNTSVDANFFTAAAALGYYDGARWGKGLVYLSESPGVMLHISDGRIEGNARWLPATGTRKCMVLVNDSTHGGPASVYLENVFGFFQERDAGVLIKDLTSMCNGVFQNVEVRNVAKLYETSVNAWSYDTAAYNNDIPGDRLYGAGNIKANDWRQMEQGIFVNGHAIEFRTNKPTSTTNTIYRKGDIVFRSYINSYTSIDGWRVIAPSVGYAVPSEPSITTAGVTTATSADVTLPAGAAWKWLGVGANIKLAGAGAAGADLLTYVTAVDSDNLTITVNTAPSTSVNPCTITMQAPTFRAMGARASTTAQRPTLTSDDVGYLYWDTTIGKAIFWNGSAWKLADGTAP
jgi:hypothetical protein